MARLTRTESQAQTREQLLATARHMFFADGYVLTSLEKVADAAGYSKGAVYSNFRNKVELCTAVLDEVRAERIEEILGIIALGDRELQLTAFDEWARRVIGDPGWTSLEIEFVSNTRKNDEVRDALSARLDSIINLMAAGINVAPGVETRLPSHETALTLLALGTGLGFFRSINPSVPVDGLIDTMRIILLRQD